MSNKHLLADPNYSPSRLLDWAAFEFFKVRNDAQLANALGIKREVICSVRSRKVPIGATLLLRLHDVTGLSARELREKMFVRG